jgi:hypothetical protein
VRDERAIVADAFVEHSQAFAESVDREVRNSPDHLAEEVDNRADVVELDSK